MPRIPSTNSGEGGDWGISRWTLYTFGYRCRVVKHDCYMGSTKKWKFVENVIFGYENERFGGINDKKTPQGRFYLHIFEKMCATLLLFTYHSDNFNKSLYTFIRLESQCV